MASLECCPLELSRCFFRASTSHAGAPARLGGIAVTFSLGRHSYLDPKSMYHYGLAKGCLEVIWALFWLGVWLGVVLGACWAILNGFGHYLTYFWSPGIALCRPDQNPRHLRLERG